MKFLYVAFVSVFILFVPLYFLVEKGSAVTATTFCLLSIIFLAVLNIEKIEAFKLWGLEAQLNRKISEADLALDNLKILAKSISTATLTEIMSSNFMGGISLKEHVKLYDEIILSLKKIGLTSQDLSDVTDRWNKGICLIYDRGIANKLFKIVNHQITAEALNSLRQEYNSMQDFKNWRAVEPERIRSFINKNNMTPDEKTLQLLDDYDRFTRDKKITNIDRFVQL